ncbi:MAG: hypothetical protein A3K10_06375, partial [Bacteroidetes bacterium RIFCSPLOWO2_12_FULL_31_6]
MVYLLLSILCSTCLFISFKWFEKYKIDSFQAIVFNSITAAICGILTSDSAFSISELLQKPWLLNACFIGIAFIISLYLFSLSIIKIGISITTVMNKISVLVPVVFAFWFYHETITAIKIVGIALGLLSIYFLTYKEETKKPEQKYLYLPIAIFILGGLTSLYIKYTQQTLLSGSDHSIFSSAIFSMAAICSVPILLFRMTYLKIKIKNIIGGILLGIPNYGSIFFLVKALDVGIGKSALYFSLNSVGV